MGPTATFPLGQIFDKGIALRFGHAPAQKYIDELLTWVEQRKIRLDDIITHRLPLDRHRTGMKASTRKTMTASRLYSSLDACRSMTAEPRLSPVPRVASDFSLPMRLRRMGRPLVITAPVRLTSTPSRRAHHSMSLFASAQGISSNLMRRRKSSTNCKAQGMEVDILVDNAGHGFHGKWWELQFNTESAGGILLPRWPRLTHQSGIRSTTAA